MPNFRHLTILSLCLAGAAHLHAQSGFVRANNQAVPGATVAATQGTKTLTTVTDADGHYGFPLLGLGTWAVTVEMFGFADLKQSVDYAAATGPVNFVLSLKPSEALARIQQFAARAGSGGGAGGTSRSSNSVASELDAALGVNSPQLVSAAGTGSSDSYLVSGSLSPGLAQNGQPDSGPDPRQFGAGNAGTAGAASSGSAVAPGFGTSTGSGGFSPGGGFGGGGLGGPGGGGGFGPGGGGRGGGGRGGRGGPGAQFGNRRRPNQIRGQASFSLNNSAVNAKPFSITGQDIPQAAYAQSRFSFLAGGPLVIPHIVKDQNTFFFISYFGTRARNPVDYTETVPTALERMGNFSQSVQSLGPNATAVPIMLFDPATHVPLPNNIIPQSRISPAALGLLNYFPLPTQNTFSNNYQYETAQVGNTDNLGVRVQRNITKLDRLGINFQYQNRDGTRAQPFRYSDETSGYGLNAALSWTRNVSPNTVSNAQIRFNRNRSETIPYFSNGMNVAEQLGIPGTSSDPANFGPPNLNFTNFGSLSDAAPALTRNQSQTVSESLSYLHGVHSISLGLQYGRNDLSTRTDPNGRGTFNFTGLATSAITGNGAPVSGSGYDLADFLLGLPQSSSIRYGASSNYFLQDTWSGYAQDEWKMHARFTLTFGLRYEYFSPLREKYGHIANLDIASNFADISVVTPDEVGRYSGAFPNGLINPDLNNFAPRVGLAWKVPHIKRSTLVRAGFGTYYNGQAYNQFATQLAQQPPFAISNSVNTSATRVLTLTQGFLTTAPNEVTNTFAVDRSYRTPYADTWNVTVQHDLPKGFFVEVGYVGTKGTRLDVETEPNQQPPGSSAERQRSQLGNAVGFIYDSSNANSIFNALQVRAVRRFSRGLSLSAYYQFAKSIDNSATFAGSGNTVAQNWLYISGERGLSNFDVRHHFDTNFVWTSPIGTSTSRIASDSRWGRLLKDWQVSGTIAAQTGLPLTARQLGNTTQLAQTGGVGSSRAEATGLDIEGGGPFFNVAAFTVAPAGVFGNAGRNTIPGPGQFTINTAFGRAFQLDESRRRLEIRIEGSNLFNHANYTSLYTVVNATNYGLPSAAGNMRTLNLVVRLRF